MPEKCSQCSRKCTRFWGELADNWACEGHYIIMNSNYESNFLDLDDEYAVIEWALKRVEGNEWLRNNPE